MYSDPQIQTNGHRIELIKSWQFSSSPRITPFGVLSLLDPSWNIDPSRVWVTQRNGRIQFSTWPVQRWIGDWWHCNWLDHLRWWCKIWKMQHAKVSIITNHYSLEYIRGHSILFRVYAQYMYLCHGVSVFKLLQRSKQNMNNLRY